MPWGDPEANFQKKTPVMEEGMTGVKGERTADVLISARRASGFRRSVMPDQRQIQALLSGWHHVVGMDVPGLGHGHIFLPIRKDSKPRHWGAVLDKDYRSSQVHRVTSCCLGAP